MKVSAITATRNRVDWLPRCIQSIVDQSHPEKEHVIIDGGSTDGTVGLLRKMSARYSHVRWISEPDRGLSDALNKGLRLASGDVVGVIGDDDYYERNAFQTVAKTFAAHPDVGLVTGNCRLIRNDNSFGPTLTAAFSSRRDLIECWKHWGKDVCIPAPSTFIQRSAIDRVGGFDETDRFAMDYRHWIKLTECSSVGTLDQLLANFRYDEGNISFSAGPQQWAETIAISRAYWGSPLTPSYWRFLASYHRHAGAGVSLRRLRGGIKRRLQQFANTTVRLD